MAEGMARLNQHVTAAGHWHAPERFAVGDSRSDDDAPQDSRHERAMRRVADVLRAVEADIIPRVVLARRAGRGNPRAELAGAASEPRPDDARVLPFADILLRHGSEAAASVFVEGVRERGASVEDVFLRLFQPAARHIGDLWQADACSFVDVTLALGVLQRLVRDLSRDFQKEAHRFDAGRQALLVPLPGDHHTFGLSIVAEFFRRSAWSVWTTPFASREELGDALSDTWFTVVGFSVSSEDRLDELAATIRVVRRHSCNGAVGILVGGAAFVDRPDRAARVGADMTGLDARQALHEAERFASRAAGR